MLRDARTVRAGSMTADWIGEGCQNSSIRSKASWRRLRKSRWSSWRCWPSSPRRRPSTRLGKRGRRGRVLIEESDLAAFLESCRVAAEDGPVVKQPASTVAGAFQNLDAGRLQATWRKQGRCWRRANLPHRFEQVRRLPGDVDVMLAHPRRGVAEKFGQRLDVHSIQDGPRAKPAVPRSGGGTAAVRGSARPRSPPDGACGRMGRPFGRRGSGSRPSFARVAPPRCSGRGAFSFTRRASWVARSVAKRAF